MKFILLLFLLYVSFCRASIFSVKLAGTCNSARMKTLGNTGTTNVDGVCDPKCTFNTVDGKMNCTISFDTMDLSETVTNILIKWQKSAIYEAGVFTFGQSLWPASSSKYSFTIINFAASNGLDEVWRNALKFTTHSYIVFETNLNPTGSIAGIFKVENNAFIYNIGKFSFVLWALIFLF